MALSCRIKSLKGRKRVVESHRATLARFCCVLYITMGLELGVEREKVYYYKTGARAFRRCYRWYISTQYNLPAITYQDVLGEFNRGLPLEPLSPMPSTLTVPDCFISDGYLVFSFTVEATVAFAMTRGKSCIIC